MRMKRQTNNPQSCGSHCKPDAIYGIKDITYPGCWGRFKPIRTTECIELIKRAIYDGGPVVVAINSDGLKPTGINFGGNDVIDHAVVAVGWAKEGSTEYFIIQNSWGLYGGGDGFQKIEVDSLNIANYAIWGTPIFPPQQQQLDTSKQYLIENVVNERYLFMDDKPVDKIKGARGSEGGWLKAPRVVGTDENYLSRAIWYLQRRRDGTYYIINRATNRYLFMHMCSNVGPCPGSEVDKINGARGVEEGWLKSPLVVGADANYYNRAVWKVTSTGIDPNTGSDQFSIESIINKRYVFMDHRPVDKIGNTGSRSDGEGGWLNSPPVIGADANYYNRAQWKFVVAGSL